MGTLGLVINCRICGEDFKKTSESSRYCSKSCRNEASRLKKFGPRVEVKCFLPECNKRFIRKNEHHKFCSYKHQKASVEKIEDKKKYYAIEGLTCGFYMCNKPAHSHAGRDWPLCYSHHHSSSKTHHINPATLTLMSFSGCHNPNCVYDISEKNKLVVDHDHACCPPNRGKRGSCGKCIRGLLCAECNRVLATVRTPEYFQGLLDYLNSGKDSH